PQPLDAPQDVFLRAGAETLDVAQPLLATGGFQLIKVSDAQLLVEPLCQLRADARHAGQFPEAGRQLPPELLVIGHDAGGQPLVDFLLKRLADAFDATQFAPAPDGLDVFRKKLDGAGRAPVGPHLEGVFPLQLKEISDLGQYPRELQILHKASTSATHSYSTGASRSNQPASSESMRTGACTDPPHCTQATRPTHATSVASPRPRAAPATRSQRLPPAKLRAAAHRPRTWPSTAGGSTSAAKTTGRPKLSGTPPASLKLPAMGPARRSASQRPSPAPPSSRAALKNPRRYRRTIHKVAPAARTASSQFTPSPGLLEQGQELLVFGPEPLKFIRQVQGGQDRHPMSRHMPIDRLQLAEF